MGVFPGPEPNSDIPIWNPVPEWSTSTWKKSRGRRNRERRARQEKKEQKREKREKRLEEEKVLRDWLREWQCEDQPAVPAVTKMRRSSNRGKEKGTRWLRRILGASGKTKVTKTKNSLKSQEKREKAEEMRRRHKEQEGTKYKPGSRKASHQDRRVKAKLEKKRVTRKLSRKVKDKEEPKIKSDLQVKSAVVAPTNDDQTSSEQTKGLAKNLTETSSEGETDSSDDDE